MEYLYVAFTIAIRIEAIRYGDNIIVDELSDPDLRGHDEFVIDDVIRGQPHSK